MDKKIASVISVIFNPLIMPSVGILLLFNSGTFFSLLPYEFQNAVFYVTLILTFVMPVVTVVFLRYRRIIDNYFFEKLEERRIPLLLTLIFYIFCTYLFFKFTIIPKFIQFYMLGVSVSVLVAFLISFRWKISIHMTGVGGVAGLAIALLRFHPLHLDLWMIAIFLVAGLVGFARLKLNFHNPLQVYAGFFVGFLSIWPITIVS